MTANEFNKHIDRLKSTYTVVLDNRNSTLSVELSLFGSVQLNKAYKKYYKLEDNLENATVLSSSLDSDIDYYLGEFEEYLKGRERLLISYGYNSKYRQIYQAFDSINTLAALMDTEDKVLIEGLIDRYGDSDLIESVYNKIKMSNINKTIKVEGKGLYDLEDIYIKLPYVSLNLMRYMSYCIVIELKNLLESIPESTSIKESFLQEYAGLIDGYYLREINESEDFIDIIINSNIYRVLAMIMPDFKYLIPANLYKNTWPYSKSALDLIKVKLRDFNLSVNIVRKLQLLNAEQTYKKFTLIEAIHLELIRRLIANR